MGCAVRIAALLLIASFGVLSEPGPVAAVVGLCLALGAFLAVVRTAPRYPTPKGW